MAAQWSPSGSTWGVFQLYLEFLLFSLSRQCSGLIWALQLSWEDGLFPHPFCISTFYLFSFPNIYISSVFKLCILKYVPVWPNSTDSSQILKSCLISGLPLLQSNKFKLSFVCTVLQATEFTLIQFQVFFFPSMSNSSFLMKDSIRLWHLLKPLLTYDWLSYGSLRFKSWIYYQRSPLLYGRRSLEMPFGVVNENSCFSRTVSNLMYLTTSVFYLV